MEHTNETPQQNRSAVYGIGALILLALLVIGYVFFIDTDMQDNDVTDLTATSTEKTTSISTTTASSTATMQNKPNQEGEVQNEVDLVLPTYSWKTYANTKYGFSFEYPADWKSTEEERGEYQFFVCLKPNDWTDTSCPISVLANEGVSLDTVYAFSRQGFDGLTVTETDTSVAGSAGKLIRVSGYAEKDAGYTKLAFFERKGIVYDVRTINGGEEIFDHILATFK